MVAKNLLEVQFNWRWMKKLENGKKRKYYLWQILLGKMQLMENWKWSCFSVFVSSRNIYWDVQTIGNFGLSNPVVTDTSVIAVNVFLMENCSSGTFYDLGIVVV